MVCDRCIHVLRQELSNASIQVEKIELGEVLVQLKSSDELDVFKKIIKSNGFEIIKAESEHLIEKLKELLHEKIIVQDGFDTKISDYVSKNINKEYSIISKLFSNIVGMTIEKYVISLKVEKAKESIQMGQLSFSEIAFALNYKSSSHLAKQFKMITGVSMSDYKASKLWNRKTLDKIV